MTRRKAARIANGVTVEMELPLVVFFMDVVGFMVVVVVFIATVADIFVSLPDFDASIELLAEAIGIMAEAAADDSCLLIAFELVAAMIVDGIGAWAVPQK